MWLLSNGFLCMSVLFHLALWCTKELADFEKRCVCMRFSLKLGEILQELPDFEK